MWTVFLVLTVLLVVVALSGNFWPEPQRPHYISVTLILLVADICILGAVLHEIAGGKF